MSESQSLLQRFFDASLIPSDTTDERLRHYQSAASDLTKRFVEVPRDAMSASRVAIDPNCPSNDPWFQTAQEAVKIYWKTFLLKNHDEPRQICRAILLEALSNAAEQDWTVSLAIWNASSNLLPHLGNGPELSITREFISGLGSECEAHTSSAWRIGSAIENTPEFEIKLPPIKPSQVDVKELTNGISDAAGKQSVQGETFGNPNPHWTSQAPQWSYEFAPRAANAIAGAVNKALAVTAPAIKGLSEQLAPALKKHANALGEWVITSAQRNERFTALLWWKQALYSSTLQCSYRTLSVGASAISTSFDLASIAGNSVPLSVEYFLRETIRTLLPENPILTLGELVSSIRGDKNVAQCLPQAPSEPVHRMSLREFLAVAQKAAPSDETVFAYTGIVPSNSLPLTEWAVWLLRERLAESLTAQQA
jgi:hypothetical protein